MARGELRQAELGAVQLVRQCEDWHATRIVLAIAA